MELRMDITKRTTQQLVREFLQTYEGKYSNDYGRGVLETAVGLINRRNNFV